LTEIHLHTKEKLFTPFHGDVSHIPLPEKFTFPFYYDPHPLCELAAKQLQDRLENDIDWKHNFGFDAEHEEQPIGKMFGVLVVQNKAGELGYLSAYSGKLTAMERPAGFVPHVYNLPEGYNFFLKGMDEINALGVEIRSLEKSPALAEAKAALDDVKKQAEKDIERYREEIRQARKARRAMRPEAETELSAEDFKFFMKEQVKESLHMRHQLRVLTAKWNDEIEACNALYQPLKQKLDGLIEKRAQCSAILQQRIFDEYTFLNQAGDLKSLHDIFSGISNGQPPAGAGECAAPKLLHYAFLLNYQPIALAEFLVGRFA
jgi:tRNA pseudouridine32 synthase/23S rRNA pseudouridine746 synthase